MIRRLASPGVTPGECSPQEKATRSNNIYVGFLFADDPATPDVDESNRPGVARSMDKARHGPHLSTCRRFRRSNMQLSLPWR
jgi:hypothetical protein